MRILLLPRNSFLAFSTLVVAGVFPNALFAFTSNANVRSLHQASHARYVTRLAYSDKENQENDSCLFDDASWEVLNQRLGKLRLDVLEKEVSRPPNAQLSACDFVQELLDGILHNEDPLPESGFRLLLRTATDEWKQALYQSVAAPPNAPEDVVASALGQAMARPGNQYALLVDDEPTHGKDKDHPAYIATFPFEPLDYFDGTAWVECRLRDPTDGTLLVSTGWTLQRNEQGAWLVAGLDWQDFRDGFRPGVGRQEWMRICE